MLFAYMFFSGIGQTLLKRVAQVSILGFLHRFPFAEVHVNAMHIFDNESNDISFFSPFKTSFASTYNILLR